MPTLDDMILFTARQTKRTEDVVKVGGVYTADALEIVNKYIDGFNYAKNKICRERYKPVYEETKVIGDDLCVDLSTLTKTAFKIVMITDVETDTEITDWIANGFEIEFTDGAGTSVSIKYNYIPTDYPNDPDATALATALEFPDGIVDFRILCFYSAYEYHLIKGSDRDLDKTGFFLSKWNDGFLHIPKSTKTIKRVRVRDYR